jgi:hypothetical protein
MAGNSQRLEQGFERAVPFRGFGHRRKINLQGSRGFIYWRQNKEAQNATGNERHNCNKYYNPLASY